MTIILSQSRSDRTWNKICEGDLFSQVQSKSGITARRHQLHEWVPGLLHTPTCVVGPSLSSKATEMYWDVLSLTTTRRERIFIEYQASNYKNRAHYREQIFTSNPLEFAGLLRSESLKRYEELSQRNFIGFEQNCNFEMWHLYGSWLIKHGGHNLVCMLT